MIVDTDTLTAGEKDELASLLRDEARRERRRLTESEAWGAFWTARLTPGWASSDFADIGRVRIACRQLLVLERWQAHQVVEAMTAVAMHVCPEAGIAHMAVEAGIADALRLLGHAIEIEQDEWPDRSRAIRRNRHRRQSARSV